MRIGFSNALFKPRADTGQPVMLAASRVLRASRKTLGARRRHGGIFEQVCAALLTSQGFTIPYADQWQEADDSHRTRKKKAASKTKYSCLTCDLNAWAKPGVPLICGMCHTVLEAEESFKEALRSLEGLELERVNGQDRPDIALD